MDEELEIKYCEYIPNRELYIIHFSTEIQRSFNKMCTINKHVSERSVKRKIYNIEGATTLQRALGNRK